MAVRRYGGSSGDDYMVGGGTDSLYGEAGNDILVMYDSRLGETKSVDGGQGNDVIQILGVFGKTWIYGGVGYDRLDFSRADYFYDQNAGYRYRGIEGAGVNIDLARNTGWNYYISANGSTWTDSNGRLAIYDIENCPVRSKVTA